MCLCVVWSSHNLFSQHTSCSHEIMLDANDKLDCSQSSKKTKSDMITCLRSMSWLQQRGCESEPSSLKPWFSGSSIEGKIKYRWLRSIRSWAMGSDWNETEEWNFAYDIPGYCCQEIYGTWTRRCCNTIWRQHVTKSLPLLRLGGKFSTNEHSEQQEWPLTHCILTSVNRYSYTVRVWHWGQGLVPQ